MLYNGDCLEIMKHLADNSIDLVLTDPPYGTTACKWDNIIDFDLMWAEIERIRNSSYLQTHTNYPRSIISFSKDKTKLHPTQKPIALMQYLIQTYSKENDIVLDFTMGSGSTGVACKQSGRRFIGIELDKGYFDIAEKRISSAVKGYYEKQNSKESI